MSEKMIDECRAQFEIWLTGDGNYPHLIHKNFGGSYLREESAMKWDGWKTAWNTRPTPASESAAGDREKLAAWMLDRSFATGHGDTLDDLLSELSWQVDELRHLNTKEQK